MITHLPNYSFTHLEVEHLTHTVHVGAAHEAGVGQAALLLGRFFRENV